MTTKYKSLASEYLSNVNIAGSHGSRDRHLVMGFASWLDDLSENKPKCSICVNHNHCEIMDHNECSNFVSIAKTIEFEMPNDQ